MKIIGNSKKEILESNYDRKESNPTIVHMATR
jgi:hypothetical protein